MTRSPNRRELLGAGLAASAASLGSWQVTNATDAITDHPFVPEATVRWSTDAGDSATLLGATGGVLTAVTERGVAGISTDGAERWRYEVESRGSQTRPYAVFAAGLALVVDASGLVALDAATGAVRWRFDGSENPAVYGTLSETVLVERDGGIVALSIRDGRERWRFTDAEGFPWTDLVSDGERAYLGTTEGELYALSAADGRVRWRERFQPVEDAGYGSSYPHISTAGATENRVFVWDTGRAALHAFDREGTRRWRVSTGEDEAYGLPGTVTDDGAYLNDGSVVRAVSPSDGAERWRFDAGAQLDWRPRRVGDAVYASGQGFVAALAPADGTERWRFATGREAAAYLIGIADGTAVVHSHDDGLYGVNADTGAPKWRFEYPGELTYLPRLDRRALYLGTVFGTVLAVSPPESTPLYDAYRALSSTAGLAVGGAVGAAVLAGAYRRFGRDDSTPDASMDIGDLEPGERIAETTLADVRRARTPADQRVSLHRYGDAVDDDAFADALATWSDLGASGVLSVRAWGVDPEPWAVTDPVETTLDARAADRSIEWIARAVAAAAEAVHRAHRDGAVHGRLTPESVWIAGDDVLVGDWGLAAGLDGSDRSAPPEDDPAPEAVDVYQLGALADRLLADDRGGELAGVASRALAADPAERYDSALAFADALRWAALEG
ncbi:outer membrane protein assembly factor BamB family protein [Halorussus marinus]|uniref:outer membrane protein assembly factor BamB family protein n=1 Tax=Halorussus marinus TaxID=2505976 RepID=UPI00143D5FC3|nr:PQQ-binding-like beta-propeller repeat protein [Halorussus marinus]